jgi:hypothetical protein
VCNFLLTHTCHLPHIPAFLNVWSANSCSRGQRGYFPLPVIQQKVENFALISVQNVFITLSNLHCVRPFNGGLLHRTQGLFSQGFHTFSLIFIATRKTEVFTKFYFELPLSFRVNLSTFLL